jgi:hypothetical protein
MPILINQLSNPFNIMTPITSTDDDAYHPPSMELRYLRETACRCAFDKTSSPKVG